MPFSIQEYFALKKPDFNALFNYGFQKREEDYSWSKPIVDNSLLAVVKISSLGEVKVDVYDLEAQEPYTLYLTKASGEYIGKVRTALENILQDIATHCFVSSLFEDRQSQAVIDFVKSHYHTTLEFLWEKSPDVAIWRHSHNQKWFGVITRLSLSKLGINSKKKADILVLHLPKGAVFEDISTSQKDLFRAWHMNKTHWYSIILDDSLSDEEVFQRIEESFQATQK